MGELPRNERNASPQPTRLRGKQLGVTIQQTGGANLPSDSHSLPEQEKIRENGPETILRSAKHLVDTVGRADAWQWTMNCLVASAKEV